MQVTIRILAFLALLAAALMQPGTAAALSGPAFDYPVDGQILDLEGAYLFRVHPLPEAEGYLWGFFQNDIMVWENFRDEGTLSGNEYAILPASLAHGMFEPGPVEVWVRAWIGGDWTDATVITIYLVPRPIYEVSIDIQPGNPSNVINTKRGGAIQVAILSTAEFNAPLLVDRNSLTFGATGAETSLVSCQSKSRDVNRDGLPDLVCSFSARASDFRRESILGILTGQMIDETPLRGQDSVRVVN